MFEWQCTISLIVLMMVGIIVSCTTTSAFVVDIQQRSPGNPQQRQRLTATGIMNYALMAPMMDVAGSPTEATNAISVIQPHHSFMNMGIQSYVSKSANTDVVVPSTTTSSSSTVLVSLQERKIPTKEEIEQKKLTFNLIFWGGGIIAPFIATVFYFGFRFWEK
jgi:hypothetical protein